MRQIALSLCTHSLPRFPTCTPCPCLPTLAQTSPVRWAAMNQTMLLCARAATFPYLHALALPACQPLPMPHLCDGQLAPVGLVIRLEQCGHARAQRRHRRGKALKDVARVTHHSAHDARCCLGHVPGRPRSRSTCCPCRSDCPCHRWWWRWCCWSGCWPCPGSCRRLDLHELLPKTQQGIRRAICRADTC